MLQDSSNNSATPEVNSRVRRKWWMAALLPAWVLIGFVGSQLLLSGIFSLIAQAGISVADYNQTILNTGISVAVYIVTLLIVIGLPWAIKKYRTSKDDLGLSRLPSWLDIVLAPAGFFVYFIGSGLLLFVASLLFPWFNADQVQDVGFNNLYARFEFILAFVTLVIVAPVAEEVLFRGYLLGKLKKYVPVWLSVVLVSLLFGFVHGAWNLALDTFILSIVLCTLRLVSKSLWPSILLHMLKNTLAFYFLFINPLLLHTLGG